MSKFLEQFIRQCARTKIKESDKEEQDRYELCPYNDRILNHLRNWGLWRKRPKDKNE